MTLEEARRQCRIDSDITSENDALTLWIQAARELAEHYTQRTFVETTWEILAADFPISCDWSVQCPAILLPFGVPLIAVDSIEYLDREGATQALDPLAYSAVADEPAYVRASRVASFNFPATIGDPGNVRIRYRAGYVSGASPEGSSQVPAQAKQAVLFLVGYWYQHRDDQAMEPGQAVPSQIPQGFYDCLHPLRLYYV